jgi:hypothetical protein
VKLVVAILLAVFALPSLATNLTVKCVAATKNVDGSALATGSTPAFNLYGNYQGNPLVLLNPTPSPACLFVRSNVNSGSIVYAVTQLTLLNGIAGPESAQTTPITTVVPAAAPPPGGVTVTLATTSTIAYMLVAGKDTYSVVIVGSAPLGTACDATKNLLGTYYVIPRASVTFTGALKPVAVLGACN